MDNYEYRVIPFIGTVKSDRLDMNQASLVSQQLQQTISQNTINGWEFYRIDKVNINVSPGCMGSLGGARNTTIPFDQVIFRRQRGP